MQQYHTQDPKILSPTIQTLFDMVTWSPGFAHSRSKGHVTACVKNVVNPVCIFSWPFHIIQPVQLRSSQCITGNLISNTMKSSLPSRYICSEVCHYAYSGVLH